jgi:RNA polymerase sigma-70 factor (ECF subfamily)
MADERTIINNVIEGNKNAFTELVEKYQNQIVNTLYRLVGRYDDAVDLAQDVFLKAYNGLPSFDERASFSTWLHKIAINTAINARRKRASHKQTYISELSNEGLDLPASAEKADYTMINYEKRDLERLVEENLSKLDDELKQVLVLKDFEDKPYKEISEILDIPLGTVRSRLHRARMTLKELIKSTQPSLFSK